MPYYKDDRQMYAQQNAQQRVTPITPEMYTPPQYFQKLEDPSQVTTFFQKYWWVILLAVVLIAMIYFLFVRGNKSSERVVEF